MEKAGYLISTGRKAAGTSIGYADITNNAKPYHLEFVVETPQWEVSVFCQENGNSFVLSLPELIRLAVSAGLLGE
jgi:hypothetical protein